MNIESNQILFTYQHCIVSENGSKKKKGQIPINSSYLIESVMKVHYQLNLFMLVWNLPN